MAAEVHIVASRRVLDGDIPRPRAVVIAGERIAALERYDFAPAGVPRLDLGGALLMPGAIDVHVHVNEPGNTAWEGFASAGRAAAAGGVTTLVDMPLNSLPVTTTPAALEAKARAAAAAGCRVDYGFWGGVVPGNHDQLAALDEAGVLGFKCFLAPSGLDAFTHVDHRTLRRAMTVLAARGAVLLAHAEDPARLRPPAPGADPRRHRSWLATRPPAAERSAIGRLIALARDTGCAVHVVHLATPTALPVIAAARRAGVAISVETCPHYLTFRADRVADGATVFKCAPPIRGRAARAGLWRGLGAGTIDLVASDHSPAPPAMKRLDDGDFLAAWGGIASLQLLLPATWTAARRRGFGLAELARWLCRAPARLAGLDAFKGRLAVGYDADLVVWEPQQTWVVDGAALEHRHPLTPYAGMRLAGVVERTFVRGRLVYDRGDFVGTAAGRRLGKRP